MTYHAEGNTRRLHVLQSAACVSDRACAYMTQPTGVSECQQMLFLYPQRGLQPKQPEAEKRQREEKKKSERRRQTEEEWGEKKRKSVHVPLCTQPRAETPLSLSISVCGTESRGVIRRQGRESVVPPATYTNIMHAAWQPHHDPHEQHTSLDAQLRPRMHQCHTTAHAFLMNEYK